MCRYRLETLLPFNAIPTVERLFIPNFSAKTARVMRGSIAKTFPLTVCLKRLYCCLSMGVLYRTNCALCQVFLCDTKGGRNDYILRKGHH
jgi:hypothetical protein